MSDYKVTCYENGKAIGMVKYTDNLDHWDGSNWTCGSPGRHLGIGRTKDGRYYLCHGTQWQGERDHAEIVSEEEARETVLHHNPDVYEEIFNEAIPEL
ncbi:hypothetical protein GF1_11590 [Desulfolithobacter dissulfuricans]|uniref:Uncharacterized protein n=1 Tax=Desulfolithobacter dissulfuricans TaxID=2795293 RepID=A0A915TZH2_9BACT|nr:hypothetical protein [Desulfolithobacter dissulfuricans]BCO08783.1 hypothetical protein GF1_11590 [Desulfolithobacter dissulfuricans]